MVDVNSAGTDVAIETADVVLMRSDPLDIATAISIGRGTVCKMRQNLGWATGYNSLALPIASGVKRGRVHLRRRRREMDAHQQATARRARPESSFATATAGIGASCLPAVTRKREPPLLAAGAAIVVSFRLR